jgi:hypothetical protein
VSQLEALGDVAAAFEAAGIEYWLFGGWAVDFHAGRVTRDHADLDLAIWLDDMPRIQAALIGSGWADLQDPDVDGGKAFGRDGVRLELTYLYRDVDGEIYTPLLDGTRGRWSPETLGDDVVVLSGVRARVAARAGLMRMKARDRGAEYQAKDAADYELLRALPPRRDPAPRSSSR